MDKLHAIVVAATTFFCMFSPECCVAAAATLPITPALFVFGDSLIDSGNNNYMITAARANYFPYGIDLGEPTGRFCNGLTVVDYGARYLGLPLIPPYLSSASTGRVVLSGVNYASAAAGILDETGRHYGERTTFNGQISQFETTVMQILPQFFQSEDELARYLAKSVFLINIGGNDYLNNYLQPNRYESSHVYSGEAFADLLSNQLSAQLTRLYKAGARKMVLVGSGPLGCIPNFLSKSSNNSCIEEINHMVIQFNSRLIDLTKTLNYTLPGSLFVYHNIYNRFSDIINNPSKYGFTEAFEACCGNGKDGGKLPVFLCSSRVQVETCTSSGILSTRLKLQMPS